MSGLLAGAALTAGFNALNNAKENSRYRQQKADTLSMWRMNNAYNSPSAQMARLKSAGLNPNLVYMNGGATPTSDTVTPPDWQTTPIQEYNGIGTMLQNQPSIEADINLKNEQAEFAKQQGISQLIRNKYIDNQEKLSISQLESAIQQNQAHTQLLGAQFGLTQQQIQTEVMRYNEVQANIGVLQSQGRLNRVQANVLKHTIGKIDAETDLAKQQVAKAVFEMWLQSYLVPQQIRESNSRIAVNDVSVKEIEQKIDDLLFQNSDEVRTLKYYIPDGPIGWIDKQLKTFKRQSSHVTNPKNYYNGH